MAKSYVVVAEYVTLKVKDLAGSAIVSGFYKGAIISNEIERESLKHHLDLGMLEEVSEQEPQTEPAKEPAKEPTVKEILDEVGDDKGKAQTALDAENAKDKPRASLVDPLQKILGKA